MKISTNENGKVIQTLVNLEKIILSKIPGYENLLAPDFFLIDDEEE